MIKRLRSKITPGVLAYVAVGVSLLVVFVVSVTSVARPDTRTTLPVCVHEDASGQAACLWDASEFGSDHPDALVFDSGKITFYPHTGELAVWDDKVNDVVTYKITEGR